ncbi:Ubiquitin-conjugating enzyme E2 22 [Bienertia sinuspersici]
MATNENLPPNVIKQLAKELKNLDETPPEGIKVGVNDDDFATIFADIDGPAGTPYENGVFRMKLILSSDFPHSPPKGYFLTKIFHPNIANNGEICVNTLKKDWNPTLGLRHVLLPKSKPKQGAVSESTTALNVDHKNNTSTQNTDQKNNTLPSTGAPSPSPLATPQSTATSKATNLQDQPASNIPSAPPSNDTVAVGSSTASSVSVPQKKDGALKAQAEKKKIDARKKSLKRL